MSTVHDDGDDNDQHATEGVSTKEGHGIFGQFYLIQRRRNL